MLFNFMDATPIYQSSKTCSPSSLKKAFNPIKRAFTKNSSKYGSSPTRHQSIFIASR